MARRKPIYVLTGESRDQETIISQKPWMEDQVRKEKGDFSNTTLLWSYNEKGNFDFKIKFWK